MGPPKHYHAYFLLDQLLYPPLLILGDKFISIWAYIRERFPGNEIQNLKKNELIYYNTPDRVYYKDSLEVVFSQPRFYHFI